MPLICFVGSWQRKTIMSTKLMRESFLLERNIDKCWRTYFPIRFFGSSFASWIMTSYKWSQFSWVWWEHFWIFFVYRLTRKSWFSALIPSGSSLSTASSATSSSSIAAGSFGNPECSSHVVLLCNKTFNQVKADLIHVLLCVSDLSHCALSNASFRAELRQRGPAPAVLFTRSLKFQVDIYQPDAERHLFAVNFQLIAGMSAARLSCSSLGMHAFVV